MTLRPFGRVTPIQIDMLQLAGYGVDYTSRRIRLGATEKKRKQSMREGLEALQESTGQDFGCDLAAWHEYLSENEEHGYTHPYAFAAVSRAILQAIDNPRRQQLAKALTQELD